MRIAIIGGGNMGGAIARGLAAGSHVEAAEIWVTAKDEASLERVRGYDPRIRTGMDNLEAVAQAELVILAVKPWLLEEVSAEIRSQLDYTRQSIISIIAGTDFRTLTRMLENGSGVSPTLYRVMPNTAISLAQSATFVSSQGASVAALEQVVALFTELGPTRVISEQMFSAATSLASCGIAFALKYMDASIRGGIELGFSAPESRAIVMQTVRGALEMMQANDTMPQVEIDKVTTPGGITLKGLAAMEEGGFTAAVLAGLYKSRS